MSLLIDAARSFGHRPANVSGRILLSAVLAAGLFAVSPAWAKETSRPAAVRKSDKADGSSIERAVVIVENDTVRGIAAENRWIRENMPGYKKVGQALLQENGGVYDRIDVQNDAGDKRAVYFDIKSFFGMVNGKPL